MRASRPFTGNHFVGPSLVEHGYGSLSSFEIAFHFHGSSPLVDFGFVEFVSSVQDANGSASGFEIAFHLHGSSPLVDL